MLLTLATLIAALQPAVGAGRPRPLRPLAFLIADSEYPRGAMLRHASGNVDFTLDVSANGAPTRCTITQPVDPDLDRTTCALIMVRARFRPAHDPEGRAIVGTFAGTIRWILPEPDDAGSGPRPDRPIAGLIADSDYPDGAVARSASGTVGVTLDVDAHGMPTHCTITESVDSDLDRATCNLLLTRAHFQPARDGHGHAIAGPFADAVRWATPTRNAGPPSFAAVHVANVVSLAAKGEITCATSSNGATPAIRTGEECGLLSGSGAAQAMRARRALGDLILIYTLTPEGAAAAPGNEEAGAEITYEATARLTIAPDGRVTDCHPGALHVGPASPAIRLPQICRMQGTAPIMVTATGQEPRRAATAIRLYFRPRPTH